MKAVVKPDNDTKYTSVSTMESPKKKKQNGTGCETGSTCIFSYLATDYGLHRRVVSAHQSLRLFGELTFDSSIAVIWTVQLFFRYKT